MKLILLLTIGAIALASAMVPGPPATLDVMAQALKIPSHCAPQEKVIFSCATANAKVISLCSSSALTSSDGYLQYRFGRGGKLELIYPATKEHPSKHFQFGQLFYTSAGGKYLKFKNGEYTYILFSVSPKLEDERAGVVVSKSGEEIAYLPCKGELQNPMSADDFDKIKIPRSPNPDEDSVLIH
jgi:hypothetical protein